MPSTKRTMAVLRLGLSISVLSQLSVAAAASPASSRDVTLSALTEVGCFSSSSGLTSIGPYTWQSQTYCQKQCVTQGHTVSAVTGGDECLCGDTLPPKSSKQSDDSKCTMPCNGWPTTSCGGDSGAFFQVFYATDDTKVPYANGGGSDSSSAAASSGASSPTTPSSSKATGGSPTTSSPATIITSISPGKTVIITQSAAPPTNLPASASSSAEKSKGGSNTAGIAAGVVIGIVVIAGLVGAAYFLWRRRQRQMQHQQMPEFGSQSPMAYKPGSAGADSRLNHDAMAQRRMSDGSIADNEDYSRRILKVTNPDDR